jgi:hypothetical protein
MKKYIILFILLFGAGIAISDIDTFEGTATDSLSDIEGSTLVAGGGANSFTFIQSNGATDTTSVTLDGVTAGNLIVVWCGSQTGGAPTVISDGTSSFTLCTAVNNFRFGYLLSANSGNRTYTFTTASGYETIVVAEFSYTGDISFDQQNTNTTESASASSGDITTTGTAELVVGGIAVTTYPAVTYSSYQINDIAADDEDENADYGAMWWKTFTETFTGDAITTISSSSIYYSAIISFKLT